MTGLPSETPEQGQEAGKRGGEMPVMTRADRAPLPAPWGPGRLGRRALPSPLYAFHIPSHTGSCGVGRDGLARRVTSMSKGAPGGVSTFLPGHSWVTLPWRPLPGKCRVRAPRSVGSEPPKLTGRFWTDWAQESWERAAARTAAT